jgi:hypothetical protein
LTSPQEEFKRLLRSSDDPLIDTDPRREAYRYAKVCGFQPSAISSYHELIAFQSDRFVMRSQLDAVDKRLPGTGVFDLKTRAVASIRNDIMNHEVEIYILPFARLIVDVSCFLLLLIGRKTRDT